MSSIVLLCNRISHTCHCEIITMKYVTNDRKQTLEIYKSICFGVYYIYIIERREQQIGFLLLLHITHIYYVLFHNDNDVDNIIIFSISINGIATPYDTTYNISIKQFFFYARSPLFIVLQFSGINCNQISVRYSIKSHISV